MLPVLIDLPFLKIYTQGVFFVLAFFWGSFMLWKNVLLTSFKEEDVFDGLFISLFGGLLISRLVHVAINFEEFGFDVLKFILINGYPGLNFWGFMGGALMSFYLFCGSRKMKFIKFIDYTVAPILLALGIGKIGAFFSGTEIGTKTNFPIAIKYLNFDGMRHLTPLYEGILFLLGSFLLYKLLFQIRRGKKEHGFNFVMGVGYICLVYVLFDYLKANRSTIGEYSLNLLISGGLLLTVCIYVIYYFRAAIKEKFMPVKH